MRTINISQREVAAFKAYKTEIKTMADHFGISIKDMRNVLITFGFAKPTATSVDYIVNPVFDMPVTRTESVVDTMVSEITSDYPQTTFSSEVNAFVTAG